MMASLRVHGQNPDDKYDNIRIGMNGRMDTIQAAVLLEKLAIFPDEIEARGRIAARYHQKLSNIATPQKLLRDAVSTWAQYTIRLPEGADRAGVAGEAPRGGRADGDLLSPPAPPPDRLPALPRRRRRTARPPTRSRATCISLPMHAYLSDETQDYIVETLAGALAG